MTGFEVVASEIVHRGAVVDSEILSIRTPDGGLVERQVVRHPGAVAVVAIHDEHVVLVEQYRAAIDGPMIEIPAGKLDVAGEPHDAAARRELIEEVGLDPGRLELLGRFRTAAGFCDEELTIFAATDCVEVPRSVDGPEEAHSTVVRVPVAEILQWAGDGRLVDAKSIIGLYWANDRGLFNA